MRTSTSTDSPSRENPNRRLHETRGTSQILGRFSGSVLSLDRTKLDSRQLSCAVTWVAALGITIERILSDNGKVYRSRVAGLVRISHPPPAHHACSPWTNGMSGRFDGTLVDAGAATDDSARKPAASAGDSAIRDANADREGGPATQSNRVAGPAIVETDVATSGSGSTRRRRR